MPSPLIVGGRATELAPFYLQPPRALERPPSVLPTSIRALREPPKKAEAQPHVITAEPVEDSPRALLSAIYFPPCHASLTRLWLGTLGILTRSVGGVGVNLVDGLLWSVEPREVFCVPLLIELTPHLPVQSEPVRGLVIWHVLERPRT